ncbi:MAG TPA: nucleotidyltransferase family protein [Longimicrobiales bacterium]
MLVLAAGMGSRLSPAARGIPKPLVRLGGRSLLEWNLAWLSAAGAREVWINLHHGADRVRGELGEELFGMAIHYSPEAVLLGTAGGWRRVVELEGGRAARWLVLYGDNLMRFDLHSFQSAHARVAAADPRATAGPARLATVALFDPAVHPNTGIAGGRAVLDEVGAITAFREGEPAAGGYVNAGAYVLESQVLAAVPQGPADFGRDVLPVLAGEGKLMGHVMERGGFCLGVDTPERLRIAESMLAAGEVAP